jgi:hypothetical protein
MIDAIFSIYIVAVNTFALEGGDERRLVYCFRRLPRRYTGQQRNLVLLNPFSIFAGDISTVFTEHSQAGVALPSLGPQDGLAPMLTWYGYNMSPVNFTTYTRGVCAPRCRLPLLDARYAENETTADVEALKYDIRPFIGVDGRTTDIGCRFVCIHDEL